MRLGGYMIVFVILALFISFIGIKIPGVNPIPETFGYYFNDTTGEFISGDVESSGFWGALFGTTAFTLLGISFTKGFLVVLLGGGSIIAGLFAKGYDTSLVLLPVIALIGGIFISVGWGVISYVLSFGQTWLTGIVVIIFGGLLMGFIMSLVDYFGAR